MRQGQSIASTFSPANNIKPKHNEHSIHIKASFYYMTACFQ